MSAREACFVDIDININADTRRCLGHPQVGVAGRTGCGKSTLMMSLYRLVEPSGGRIIIDGVNTATIGLQDLRSRLALVPQVWFNESWSILTDSRCLCFAHVPQNLFHLAWFMYPLLHCHFAALPAEFWALCSSWKHIQWSHLDAHLLVNASLLNHGRCRLLSTFDIRHMVCLCQSAVCAWHPLAVHYCPYAADAKAIRPCS